MGHSMKAFRGPAWARLLALMAVLALLGSGCGARWSPDRELRLAAEGGAVVSDEGVPNEASGVSEGNISMSGGAALPSAPGGAPSTGSVGSSTGQTSDLAGSTGTGTAQVDAGPHPGVTDTEIALCYLVPLTGASPVPTDWKKGVTAYWENVKKKGGIHGRNIKLIVKDTGSEVETALSEARNCINEKAFSFLIMDRTPVEAAALKFLNDQGVPGVMIVPIGNPGLEPGGDWVNVFGVVAGVKTQGRLIADYFTTGDLAGKRLAVAREDAQDTVPATEAFKARLADKGVKPVAEEKLDPQGNDFSAAVLSLSRAKAEVVWVYTTPVVMIKLAQQAAATGYRPIWFACAPSWNFNQVLQVGNAGGAMKGARAFSPWIALSSPGAEEFKAVYRQMYNEEPDDIGIIGWGYGEVFHAALQAAGRDLSHSTFRAAFQSLSATPKIWAPLRFGPGVRVGSDYVMEFREAGDH
ncbi:MAG: ABC transporter substrate-binding protein, partial [Actinomycetota bacterium]